MSVVSTMKNLDLYKILLEKLRNSPWESHQQYSLQQLLANIPKLLGGRCSSILLCVLHFFQLIL